ncbi:MAG: TRAP transporter large permease [Gammaproteobacteria bacterium]|nr:TRAP transporter large permease [Gammaproteobacteria bacterium]
MDYLPALLMFALFVLDIPIAFGMAIAALSFFVFADGLPLRVFVQKFVQSTDSFPLLAVPFFICAGSIMNRAGITRRLLNLADALVGHMVGGIAQANVVLATLMGGLSASSNAEAAMQAKMLGTEMVRRGYSAGFAAAITACAAVITPIIPPGIGLIIYGYLSDVSVGRLFIGGIVPGLLLCVGLMVTVHWVSKKRGYKAMRERRVPMRELGRAFVDGLGALSIIAFILIGIRYGIFMPTEAGAMTVVYAALIGTFWHRELKWAAAPKIILETVLATSAVMVIICAAGAFGFYMSWERIPARGAEFLIKLTREPWLLLLMINVGLIVIGMLIEGTAALILLTPILVPAVTKVGIDPLHFGLVMVVNLTLGGVTPPVGTMMFTTCSILRVKIETFAKEGWPMMLSMFIVLMLITYVPGLVTWLPTRLMGP